MISFKCGLILLRYASIYSVFSYPHYFHIHFHYSTYSYYLIKIFFFLLKKAPNIPDYSLFGCFIFFCQSRKISYTSNYVVKKSCERDNMDGNDMKISLKMKNKGKLSIEKDTMKSKRVITD